MADHRSELIPFTRGLACKGSAARPVRGKNYIIDFCESIGSIVGLCAMHMPFADLDVGERRCCLPHAHAGDGDSPAKNSHGIRSNRHRGKLRDDGVAVTERAPVEDEPDRGQTIRAETLAFRAGIPARALRHSPNPNGGSAVLSSLDGPHQQACPACWSAPCARTQKWMNREGATVLRIIPGRGPGARTALAAIAALLLLHGTGRGVSGSASCCSPR